MRCFFLPPSEPYTPKQIERKKNDVYVCQKDMQSFVATVYERKIMTTYSVVGKIYLGLTLWFILETYWKFIIPHVSYLKKTLNSLSKWNFSSKINTDIFSSLGAWVNYIFCIICYKSEIMNQNQLNMITEIWIDYYILATSS